MFHSLLKLHLNEGFICHPILNVEIDFGIRQQTKKKKQFFFCIQVTLLIQLKMI